MDESVEKATAQLRTTCLVLPSVDPPLRQQGDLDFIQW